MRRFEFSNGEWEFGWRDPVTSRANSAPGGIVATAELAQATPEDLMRLSPTRRLQAARSLDFATAKERAMSWAADVLARMGSPQGGCWPSGRA